MNKSSICIRFITFSRQDETLQENKIMKITKDLLESKKECDKLKEEIESFRASGEFNKNMDPEGLDNFLHDKEVDKIYSA